MDTQTIPNRAGRESVRRRIETADEPNHPLRRHLFAARQASRPGLLKSLFRLRFRGSGAAA